MTDRQRNLFVLLLVAGLLAGSVVALAAKGTRLGLDLKGGVELVYQGQPTAQTPVVTQDALQRAVDIIGKRINQLGVSEPQVQRSGANQIDVGLPGIKDFARAEKQVGTTAQLAFFDWEASTILPDGRTPAQLGVGIQQNPAALALSGSSSGNAGSPGAGSISLHAAVTRAAAQPYSASPDNTRISSEYYLFGAPGSQACAASARGQNRIPTPGAYCLLAGPDEAVSDLSSNLPQGVTSTSPGVEQLVVKRGTVVVQAVDRSTKEQTPFNSPSAQFFVLRDHAALLGTDISDPKQSTDQGGSPDVSFGFGGKGGAKFQAVTKAIARRGALVSGLGATLDQHFAVALDNKLVTVPQIDFKQYPDGITGDQGADITGGFTIQSAQDLANLLRLGALPIRLKLISESQVSATLGKQALHQGLIAGAAGLGIVAIFLIAFYRVLGVIAVGALGVYALYFFALIKLIPITLTLPGIAGLILTIGVAADANIVIFERVKEEIRAGRTVRQGIALGYRKGLTAIIDANVVTIMTAFILFVLATAGVKGFAFTLGIGTIVSLFTAVMATQATLSSMGSSRAIASPALLGARPTGRRWRYDFMGASKYFFSMSGLILLIGALAIGGKGLNLGIDFTSGTRIQVGLARAASEAQVREVMRAGGVGDATVQRVTGDKTLGRYGFQISSKKLQPTTVPSVRAAFASRFGIAGSGQDFSTTSVGPTFGSTVANGAIVAIIASLLVISAYVWLRFEWKFAIPVLIALMHDLLITAGVYSLTGREVTTATVAALLTILGYSLYDTIIVFDRVRENVPRMPRAAFSQIVNRSMAEVLTRSVATTSCTLMPIIALLAFGGSTLGDFAFALLIGVASGAYSSIFIASPVLTHWKEREPAYAARRRRITGELGHVPAYPASGSDVDPTPMRARRTGRLTTPEAEQVSAAEFEQMKRDLDLDDGRSAPRRTSTRTITRRLAHVPEAEVDAPSAPPPRSAPPKAGPAKRPPTPDSGTSPVSGSGSAPEPKAATDGPARAPDEAEDGGMSPRPKPPSGGGASKGRNRARRRHGRR